jgi:hypothetical protein
MNKDEFIKKISEKYDGEHYENIKKYVNTLNENEYETLVIAYEHLGSSFHILKSVGYTSFCNKN